MTEEEYLREVRSVLDEHSDEVVNMLHSIARAMPERAEELHLQIFVDQDGQGFLSVRASLAGPDLYVLQQAIRANADLFSTRMVDCKMEPPLPLPAIPNTDQTRVKDILTDCAVEWLTDLWSAVDSSQFSIPTFIVSHDEHGQLAPLELA